MLGFILYCDALLANILPHELLRILFWSMFSAAFSMLVYRIISPQARLKHVKTKQKAARKTLLTYDGEFEGMVALIKQDLTLASRQILLTVVPFMVSFIPTLALVFCLYTIYGYRLPEPGQKILVQIEPETAQPVWSPTDLAEKGISAWHITWPEQSTPLILNDANGVNVLQYPLKVAIPEITKDNWLTALFPNPAGAIQADAAINSVYTHLPVREYITIGPKWMRGFTFWYFTLFLLTSIAIKIRFKIA